jgi:hypothetical protein
MTVHATWNRRFWGFQILAFADRSYVIDIGAAHRPALVSIGWYRWHPDSIEFPGCSGAASIHPTEFRNVSWASVHQCHPTVEPWSADADPASRSRAKHWAIRSLSPQSNN